MATSLQRQLASLAAPSSALLVPERRITSILFTSKEAAGHNRETFHTIGLAGLRELIDINPRLFEKYVTSRLFDKRAVEFERVVEDRSTNEELDEEIEDFLISLSPYFTLKSSLQCLEWLVNRFHIEKFNISSILESILPYYDTKSFSLVIKVLEIERFKTPETKHWHWLVPSVQAALPLTKNLLYSNSNPKFVNWLFSTLKKFIRVHGRQPSALQPFICFMTSTVVGILNAILHEIPKRKEKNQRNLFRSKGVVHSLWSQIQLFLADTSPQVEQNEEIQCMFYVICSLLGLIANQKPELNEGHQKLIGNTVVQILKNHPPMLTTQVYLLLNILSPHTNQVLKFQKTKLLPILRDVTSISQTWDVYNISTKILMDNVSYKKSGLTQSKIWSTIELFKLNPTQRSQLLKNVYQKLKVSKSYATKKWAKGFLSKFEREYPTEFALVCDLDPKFAEDLVHSKKGEDVMLLVQHPDPFIRMNAVRKILNRFRKKYLKKLESGKAGKSEKKKGIGKAVIPKLKGIKPDENSTARAILPRFHDEDPSIVEIILKLRIEILNNLFRPETLADALIDVIIRRPTLKCTKKALLTLCKVAECNRDEALTSKILGVLMPLLFPRREGVPMKLVWIILGSKFAQQHKFLKQYSSLLDTKAAVTCSEVCEFSYNALKCCKVSLLSKNLDGKNLSCKLFSLLASSSPDDVDKIINSAESMQCAPTGNFPITPAGFSICLTAAEKKGILSLDFVFSVLLGIDLRNRFNSLQKVMKFAWKVSNQIEHRHICLRFLSELVKKSFVTSGDEINFWSMMIRTSNENCNEEDEYFLTRTLQFLLVSLEQHPEVLKEYLSSAALLKPRILTRSVTKAVVVEEEAGVNEKLLEILLSRALYHDSYRIRSLALDCLSLIGESAGLEIVAENFFKTILARRREIVSDKQQAVVTTSSTLEKPEFFFIREHFVDTVVDEKTDQSIAIGLLKLCNLVSREIFIRFLPIAKELLIKNPSSKILLAVLDCYDTSIDASMEIVQEALKHTQTYSTILSKLSREAVDSQDRNWRKSMFEILVANLLNCEIPEIKVGIQRCVRKWTLEAAIITEELDKCIAMEKIEGGTALAGSQSGSSFRKTKPSGTGTQASLNVSMRKLIAASDWSRRTEVILELIQSKKRLIQKTKLIRPLFKLLKICIALEEQSPVEYLKQLILTSLTLCCSDDSKSQESNDDWMDFNVETVIDCLRCSRNPQTHHHALILLNYAAQLYPEQVLHGVMSLFTFMGNSILRQDDTYSTQLIQQTVTTIIPTFVNTNVVRKYSVSRVSAGIYFAFASAVQDIPVHRRLPVFSSLVETLQPNESLWQLCVIIIDKALMRDKKRSHLTADIELALDIVGNFDPSVSLSTTEKIYNYLSELPIYERISEEDFQIKRLTQNANAKAVVDLTRKESLRDVVILVYYTLELVMKICAKFADMEQKLPNYDTLLEKCFSFSRLVSNIHEDKIFRLIAQRNLDIIEKVNAALEPADLIRTVITILLRDDLSVKKKMLDLLNHRIAHKLDWFGKPKILLDLIHPLVGFCNTEHESDDVVTVIQTAFISLKLISRHLASSNPELFVPVFELTFKHTTDSNRLLCASAFACLGELFCLKSLILPNLNAVCAAILKAFKASSKINFQAMQLLESQDGDALANGIQEKEGTRQEADMSVSIANLLCISTLTCFTKLCDQLGSFIGAKFLQKSLLAMLRVDGIFGHGEKAANRKKTFDQRLKALLKSVGTKIPLRNSLPSIQKIFQVILSLEDFHHTNAIVLLIDVLKETLANTSKADFTTLFPGICEAFLVDFLPYREFVTESWARVDSTLPITEEDLVEVEDAILGCLINGVILKVSESVFRSFYHRIFDWAGESVDRLITFYRFSGAAAEKLKSLFVTFAGYVINQGAESLSKNVFLTRAILKYFYHIFSNDREGFITIDRFNALVKPLVDLIESEYTTSGGINIKDINDTLVQLAVATNDLNRWQYLVELISLKSQHPDRKVRRFVISTLAAAANELGKDFLPLLPPAVPFLAELLNDDDEEVEKETKRMLLKLEDILGEPLQPYFVA